MERRRFNTSERVAAFLVADGKCEECGADLEPGWHGHHNIPYSRGGATDAINARALCPICNRRLGNKMRKPLRPWPPRIELHDWQAAAFKKLLAKSENEFLCVAWPGTGKTLFALSVAHRFYEVGDINRIIVVAPSTHLREQWAISARLIGIDLDYEFENKASAISSNFQGVVVTDAAVYHETALYRRLSAEKTLVILDECHHGGIAEDDQQGWGYALDSAFRNAYFKLSLSGTPFRSDNKKMPFISYDDSGVSIPDYYYSYGDALADRVVRELYFPRFEGDMSWLDDDEYYQHSFNDELNKRQESNRLKTALDKGSFVEDMIRKQHADLMMLREGEHPNAAGLIICVDQDRAEKDIARKVKKITGYDPVVVLSKYDDAHEKLKNFRESSDPWLVAVRMVTEGVDIPRLRTGIYASNVVSELSVIQFFGRFVRKLKKEDGVDDWWASVALPADRRFIEIVQKIKQQRNHELSEEQQKRKRREIEGGDPRSGYIGHEAKAKAAGFNWDEKDYEQSFVEKCKPLKTRHNMGHMTDEQFAAFVHDVRGIGGFEHTSSKTDSAPQSDAAPDLTALRKLKRTQANKQAYRLDKLLEREPGSANAEWRYANKSHDDASIEDLDKKLRWLEGRIYEATKNGKQ
jgi:superfamily II DNA or RNA helicase